MSLPDFADDAARLDWIERMLYTGVLSDACDAAGHRDRALLPDIRPLDETRVLAGRAKTVVWAPMFHVPPRPYDREIAAVDSLAPGEVFVMAVGRSTEIVPWGELLSTATQARGGRGAVLDGLVRDTPADQGDGPARLLRRPASVRLVRPGDRRRFRRSDRARRGRRSPPATSFSAMPTAS